MVENSDSILMKNELVIWLFRRARLMRFPFDLGNGRYVDLVEKSTTGVRCRIEAYLLADGHPTLHFGINVQINDYVHICSMESVRIGNNVLLAGKVYISDNSHGSYKGNEKDTSPDVLPTVRPYPTSPVEIEDNVWIGEGVVVLPGVTIGRGSIIGANSVVSKNIPEYTIAVGQPAKSIKKYIFETRRWKRI